jgi:hypothetical protein
LGYGGGSILPGDADILTIAAEAATMRSVLAAFPAPAWRTVHAGSIREAAAYLRYNRAAVALVEAPLTESDRKALMETLHSLPNAPEALVLAPEGMVCDEVLPFGGCNVLTIPARGNSLMWAVRSARRAWLERHVNTTGGWLCSDA